MTLEKVIVASSNEGKIREIKEIFTGVEIVSLKDLGFNEEIPETGETFKENALIKAGTICKKYGLPALADDSGLCVYALDLAPGIYSARFSGEGSAANRKLLLKRMEGLTDRKAYFECSVCLCFPDGKTIYGQGRTYGRILYEEIGSNGFGYDPLFWSLDLRKSFGVATEEEKNSVSHRARALKDLADKIARL
ncbi:MAG: RdgB/HAM1 family non-canonical purine NTP pyrophosphatase [Clostridia bacterium]|nr:RdgB/HAM1 family non-canonical purine NTP pyrophosphatase [Clostridia bacterium]